MGRSRIVSMIGINNVCIYMCIYVFTRSKREFFDYSALVPFMLIEVASYIIQRFYVIMGGSMVRVELLRG